MRSPHPSSSTWASTYHSPVLVAEVVTLLHGTHDILDGTLGGGGHALALLDAGAPMVVGLDRDPEAIAAAGARLAHYAERGRFRAVQGNFAAVDEIDALDGARFGGILLDLGVSSHQLDDGARGFSFRPGVPLDMRMEFAPGSGPGDGGGAHARGGGHGTRGAGHGAGHGAAEHGGRSGGVITAAELLNVADVGELTRIFRELGDEPRANRLAREIVRRRGNRALATSDDLVGAIRGAFGPRTGPPEFARLFQAVRIAVNDELGALERALPRLRDRLRPGGVIAVIAYHSGEDRMVKHAFRRWSTACTCPPRQPVCTCGGEALGETVTRKALTASADEIERNARARSARLRAWRRAG